MRGAAVLSGKQDVVHSAENEPRNSFGAPFAAKSAPVRQTDGVIEQTLTTDSMAQSYSDESFGP